MWRLIVLIILLIFIFIHLRKIKQKCKRTTPGVLESNIQQYVKQSKPAFENGDSTQIEEIYNKEIFNIVDKVSHIGLLGLNEQDIIDISWILCKNPHKHNQANTQVHNTLNTLANTRTEWNLMAAQQPENICNEQHIHPSSKLNAVNTYIKQAKKIKPDSQNVHDSAVNNDLMNTYTTMKNDQNQCLASDDLRHQITQMINTTFDDNEVKKNNALRILDKIYKEGLYTHSLNSQPIQLSDILNTTWNRSLHPLNSENREEMRKSLVNALADCMEKGYSVCSGGISARILASPVLLDFNNQVGQVMTKQGYKAEVFSKSNDLLQETIQEYANQELDPDMKTFSESFTNIQIDDSTIPIDVKNRFYRQVEHKIDKMLLDYQGKIPDETKSEIMAGIKM